MTNPSFYRKRIRPFFVVSYEVVMRCLFALPRYRFLNHFKSLFLQLNGALIGRRVIYYPGVWIAPGRNLVIGDDVDLAFGVLIETSGGVTIGDRTLVGFGTKIFHVTTSSLRNAVGFSVPATPINPSPSVKTCGLERMSSSYLDGLLERGPSLVPAASSRRTLRLLPSWGAIQPES